MNSMTVSYEWVRRMKVDIALEEDCLMARTRKIDNIDSDGLVSGFNLVLHTHKKICVAINCC